MKMYIPTFTDRLNRKWLLDIWRKADDLQEFPLPRVVSSHGQRHAIAMPDANRMAGQESACRPCAHNRCKLVLGSERGDHFARAGGMFVDQEYGPAVKRLWAEIFSGNTYRLIA